MMRGAPAAARLGLGGHSFIADLGNDPRPSFDDQCAIVSACLDAGIRLIDTTYFQERVALGRILRTLGRRDDAALMAWNFFAEPGRENELVPHLPYEPHHIDVILGELRTDHLEVLVVHTHRDAARLREELGLAGRWVEEGKVGKVGLGMARRDHLDLLPSDHPLGYVLAPYNAFERGALDVFTRARQIGLGVIALSPFVRGWKLDETLRKTGEDRQTVAALLLRWVACQDVVDHVVVSMRKPGWVRANLEAVRRGPLSAGESARLRDWLRRVG